MSKKVRLALIGGVFIAIAVAAGVSTWLLVRGDGQLAQPAGAAQQRWTIEDARQFKEFTLYWLGETFEGLPLTTITRYRYDPPGGTSGQSESSVAFIYGDCTPGPDSGCAPPLQIILESYCMRPPELLAPGVKEGPAIQVRGALAQPMGPKQVMVWAGDVRINVFDVRQQGSALSLAEALEAVAPGGPRPAEPLPPPDAVKCQ